MSRYLKLFGFICVLMLSDRSLSQNQGSDKLGGADEIEGWIYKKTKKGIIKIPKKQKFRFEGSTLEGEGVSPPATTLQPRLAPKRQSLISVRDSFKNEFYDSLGISRNENRGQN